MVDQISSLRMKVNLTCVSMIINVEKLFAPKFYHDRKISSNGVDILQKWNSKAMVFICWTVIAEELVL